MNREILFRAKRKDNNEWIEGNLIHYIDNYDNGLPDHYYQEFKEEKYFIREINLFCGDNQGFIEVIPETVGQYTGLNDKNGVKIFEGDIIRLDDEHRRMISSARAKKEEELVRKDCLVEFKDGSFMFCRNKYVIDDFDSYLWITNKYCEVIGNIHDNPELLDKEVK